MKQLSQKAKDNLGKYDRRRLNDFLNHLADCRTEYCDIFELLCLNECNKPKSYDFKNYKLYVDSQRQLKNRLQSCMRVYNKALIKYYAFIDQLETEYKGQVL